MEERVHEWGGEEKHVGMAGTGNGGGRRSLTGGTHGPTPPASGDGDARQRRLLWRWEEEIFSS
uniref:Uncharacterized protein n=1 Tax=Leersia perrieri TaxID=77586 RepID=A0A0D9XF86_9ORYZ